MEQTKGYFGVRGKIWGLNNKTAKENQTGTMRSLSLAINTRKDNSLFLQVGKWVNSTMNVKIKSKDMEKVEEFNEQEAIDKILKDFKDGDSVYINCRVDVNDFSKRLDYMVSQIYILDNELDFDSELFEESNNLNTSLVVLEKPVDQALKAGLVDYHGNMIEVEFKLYDEDVKNYFIEKSKVGDLMKVTAKVINRPIYEEGSETSSGGSRKTLKGKVIESSNGRKKVKDYVRELEIVDVDIEKTESKKYDREEIRKALEDRNIVNNNAKQENDDDGDLPF